MCQRKRNSLIVFSRHVLVAGSEKVCMSHPSQYIYISLLVFVAAYIKDAATKLSVRLFLSWRLELHGGETLRVSPPTFHLLCRYLFVFVAP